jgi:hypothetical protein
MATRVGSATTASSDGASSSIALPARNVASNERPTVYVKWEDDGGGAAPVVSTATDNVGNAYSILVQAATAAGASPGGAWIVATGATFVGDANLVITVNFSSAFAFFRRAALETWTTLSANQADTAETGSGSGTTYSTAALTSPATTTLMLAGVSGFTTLSGHTAGGTPAAALGGTLTDTFIVYLSSTSAQTITPGASATGSDAWKMLAILLAEADSRPAYGVRNDGQYLHDGATGTRALLNVKAWV